MIVAVDVGGTKTLIADFDSKGNIGQQVRFATPKDETEFLETLVTALQDTYPDPTAIDALCVALPGMIEASGILRVAPNLGWRNIAITDQLARYFSCPIYVQNDANLAGLAEAHALTMMPALCLYVTISTGIGTGIITGGRLDQSLSASEAGHMILEYDGRLREWESFASGKSILKTYGKYGYEITSKTIWKEIADKISRGLLVLIPTLQPEIIVIGGSMGTHFSHYREYLEHILHERLDRVLIPVPQIVQAKHPQEAVIYGCYYYAVHQLDV
jgi:predicted NBD/HSP70 family sugar kinase